MVGLGCLGGGVRGLRAPGRQGGFLAALVAGSLLSLRLLARPVLLLVVLVLGLVLVVLVLVVMMSEC